MSYDYKQAVMEDVTEYIRESVRYGYIHPEEMSAYDLIEKLEEELWAYDGVTGNASGSYTFSSSKAKEYVINNISLLGEAAQDFGDSPEQIGRWLIDEDWETMDVIIRCWLLRSTIEQVVNEMAENGELRTADED